MSHSCPLCGCQTFYCKDPDDEYETYELSFSDQGPDFAEAPPEDFDYGSQTGIFCNQCTWNGKHDDLK